MASRHKFIGLAFSILRNREDAEDAVQDALVSAYIHARSFEGRSALATWFTRIVFNAALMIRRKRKSLNTDSLPESSTTTNETPWMEKIPDPQPDPEASYAEQETSPVHRRSVSKMSPILRQAFTMAYFDEMSNEEACERLGIAAGTFKSRVFRARQQLMNKAQRVLFTPVRSRVRHSPIASSKSEFGAWQQQPLSLLLEKSRSLPAGKSGTRAGSAGIALADICSPARADCEAHGEFGRCAGIEASNVVGSAKSRCSGFLFLYAILVLLLLAIAARCGQPQRNSERYRSEKHARAALFQFRRAGIFLSGATEVSN